MKKVHEQTVYRLEKGKTYYLQILATDISGKKETSAIHKFVFKQSTVRLPGGGRPPLGPIGSGPIGRGARFSGALRVDVARAQTRVIRTPPDDPKKHFCEANLDCATLMNQNFDDLKELIKNLHDQSPEEYPLVEPQTHGAIMCDGLDNLQDVGSAPPLEPLDLERIRDSILDALNPENSIVGRAKKRLRLNGLPELDDSLKLGELPWEFPDPMYEPLRDLSQDLLLPGLDKVPQNTISLLKTNGRFVEAYMVGCNHGFIAEAIWREYPAISYWSYFRQFWDVSGYIPSLVELDEIRTEIESEAFIADDAPDREQQIEEEIEKRLAKKLKDIAPIHLWNATPLGDNDNRPAKDKKDHLVLIIRGDLLKKYPNTVIYAIPARVSEGKRVPALPEFLVADDLPAPQFPIFSGTLPPDITFLGFDIPDEDAARGTPETPETLGWYFVIEERVSEARFGMDIPDTNNTNGALTWDDLSWNQVLPITEDDDQVDVYVNAQKPNNDDRARSGSDNTTISWNGSAEIAAITFQKPVRIAVHARKMIPKKE